MSDFEIATLKNAVLQGFSGRLKASKTAKTNFKITDFEIGSIPLQFHRNMIEVPVLCYCIYYRGSFKTEVLKEQPLKKAVLQAVGRKIARASAKPTGFCKKLYIKELFF
jgi:hypothetical protein